VREVPTTLSTFTFEYRLTKSVLASALAGSSRELSGLCVERTFKSIAARICATVSALLAILIIIFVAFPSEVNNGVVPQALAYSFAFALSAFWTWRMSRAAAVLGFLLYLSMQHSGCGLAQIAVKMGICVIYVGGIANTILFRQKMTRAGEY
jgi:hypothetical protein